MDAVLFFTVEDKVLNKLEFYQKSISFEGQVVFDEDVYYKLDNQMAFKKVERPEWLNQKSKKDFSGIESSTLVILDNYLDEMRDEIIHNNENKLSAIISLLVGVEWESVFLDGYDRADVIGSVSIDMLIEALRSCIIGRDRRGFIYYSQ